MSTGTGDESATLERCEVVDEFGNLTGRTVSRGAELGPGEFYPVVHVWIRDEAGNYLIQQRALDRASDPGVWATTAGYLQAGEDSLPAAIREVWEELGIQLSPAQLRFWKRIPQDDVVQYVWLAEAPRHAIGAPVPGPEVADWMWVSRAELEARIGRGKFFAYSYFNDLPG